MTHDMFFSSPEGESRRTFIKKAATAAAVVTAAGVLKTPVYGQSQAPSTGRVIGANDRIAVAYIGTGVQGLTHVRSQKENAKDNNIVQAAVCDLYKKRLNVAAATAGLSGKDACDDYRTILDRNDIDAVVVSTVDNWHAQVAIDALQSGKHVYGEKPMARYLEEGFGIYDKVKQSGKVFQIGSQYLADPMVHKAAEWVKAGKLGPLDWAQGSYCRNNPKNSEWTYPVDAGVTENDLHWNVWQGKAQKVPFDPNRYFSWHKFYAYNSGILGNLLSHMALPLLMATGSPEFPCRVVCTGTRKISTDREINDTTHVLAEYPSGMTLCLAGSTVNEQGFQQIIRGRKATLYFSASQNRVELKPERPFTDEIDAAEFADGSKIGEISRLEKNFFDCIRSGQTPYGSVDLAIRVHAMLCMAELSDRMKIAVMFDEKTRTLHTGDGKPIKPLSYDTVIPA